MENSHPLVSSIPPSPAASSFRLFCHVCKFNFRGWWHHVIKTMISYGRRAVSSSLFLLLSTLPIAFATVFFEERFEDGWEKRWVISEWQKEENMTGKWKHTSGVWSGDHDDKGIQTSEDYRFYAISAEFPEFSNKDKTFVLQFSVKHEQELDCGGGYIKLLSGEIDQKKFGGETPYSIMFGPDICGQDTRRVHAIISRKGHNYLIKKNIACATDQLTHVYTFIVRSTANYSILIDNKEQKAGSLYDDWDILPPRKIADPHANKPDDWDDRDFIPDPEDKEPEGYDEIPKEIPAPYAEKPEDWDDEEDGQWEPPTIPNPEYKGPWIPKQIKNPNYQGKWKAPTIDNPEFKDDPDLYVFRGLRYVGIELWQVKSGTLFDNILICDDPDYARQMVEETWEDQKDTEREEFHLEKTRRRERGIGDEEDDDYDDEDFKYEKDEEDDIEEDFIEKGDIDEELDLIREEESTISYDNLEKIDNGAKSMDSMDDNDHNSHDEL